MPIVNFLLLLLDQPIFYQSFGKDRHLWHKLIELKVETHYNTRK